MLVRLSRLPSVPGAFESLVRAVVQLGGDAQARAIRALTLFIRFKELFKDRYAAINNTKDAVLALMMLGDSGPWAVCRMGLRLSRCSPLFPAQKNPLAPVTRSRQSHDVGVAPSTFTPSRS